MKHQQPYLPARALGVEEWERRELIALAARLIEEDVVIDMTRAASDCGSVGCIGGHVAMAHGVSIAGARRYVQQQAQAASPLAALYFPDLTVNQAHPGWRASAPDAARAIINFLMRGDPEWGGVMATSLAGARRKTADA